MRTITGLSITSLNGGTITFDNSNYILTEVHGLESPIVRLPRYNLPGASGAQISNALYGERAIQIKGVVNAPDGLRTTYLTNRLNLIDAVLFQTDNDGNLVPQTLTISLENGLILTADVYTDKAISLGFSPENVDYEEFFLSLVAVDPLLYSTIQSSYTVSPPVGGGTAIPTAIPISLAPSSGGQVVVTNSGSTSTAPVITLVAPLTNPYITNRRTNQFLSINYTLNIGDNPLVIDCQAQTITQGTGDVTGIQSSDSTFWSVLPGSNTIGFSAAAGTGTATIAFYPAYFGF